MSTYEQALRDCLRDCGAILQAYNSYIRAEDLKHIIRDIDLLLGREDCSNYDYKKDKISETDDEIIASETRARHLWHKERDDEG